jgi:hypothetical protein
MYLQIGDLYLLLDEISHTIGDRVHEELDDNRLRLTARKGHAKRPGSRATWGMA